MGTFRDALIPVSTARRSGQTPAITSTGREDPEFLALVDLRLPGGRVLRRRAGTDGSYASAGDPGLHCGLGGAGEVESVDVRWPSGRRERFGPVAAGSEATLREGEGEPLR